MIIVGNLLWSGFRNLHTAYLWKTSDMASFIGVMSRTC